MEIFKHEKYVYINNAPQTRRILYNRGNENVQSSVPANRNIRMEHLHPVNTFILNDKCFTQTLIRFITGETFLKICRQLLTHLRLTYLKLF